MVLNAIVLQVKQYIYRKRCKKELPYFSEVEYEILDMECIEKYNAKMSGKTSLHHKKWFPDNPHIEGNLDVEEYCRIFLENTNRP